MTRTKSPKDVLNQLKSEVDPAIEDGIDSLEELLDKYQHSAQSIRGIQGALKELEKAKRSIASSVAVLQMEVQ